MVDNQYRDRKILVVDDEERMVRFIRLNLEHDGFRVIEAFNGNQAINKARSNLPDLVLLDVMMPDLDGFEVLRVLREVSTVPVIMLTAKGEEEDRVRGLELGADDYITKPFSPKELVARVRVLFRRMENYATASQELLHAADLTLDVPRMRVSADGRDIEELTPTEFALLAEMARYPGRVFTRAQLLDAVHGVAFESYERAIDAHVKNIRHKIEPDPPEPRYLLTVYGVGYKFTDR